MGSLHAGSSVPHLLRQLRREACLAMEPGPQGRRVAADLETGQCQPCQAAQETPLAERLGRPAVGADAVAAAASAIALRLRPRTWDHSHFQQFTGQGPLTFC